MGHHLGLDTGAQISDCKAPSLSIYRLRSALDWYGNGSEETTVVMSQIVRSSTKLAFTAGADFEDSLR